MLASTDAPPRNRERTVEPGSPQAAAPSRPDRSEVSGLDKPRIGRDGVPPGSHRGTIIVASVWLAFYVILAIHHFISSGN